MKPRRRLPCTGRSGLCAIRPAATAAFAVGATAAPAAADRVIGLEGGSAASWAGPGVLSILAVILLSAVAAWHLVRRRRMRADKAALEAAMRDLREREERFRILVEHQTDLVVKVDPQGRFLYVSPAYCRTFGKSEAELLGHAFLPMVHEDDIEATREAMKTLLVPPHRAYMEQRAMTAEGWRWIAWNDSAIVGPDGGIVEIIGVGRDITARKQSEELLRQSEERFAKSFHSNPGPLVLSDIATGKFLDVNARWVEMLGYPREEQLGRTSKEVGIWADPAQRDRAIAVLRENGSFKDFPIEFLTQAGETRFALWSAEVVSLQGRDVMLSLLVDVTDRRRTEEALRTSEKLYRSVIDNIEDVFYRTDAAGRLCMLSPSGVRLLGYGSVEEMLGRPNDEFWYEADRRQEFLERMRSRGRITDYEVLLKRADGTPVQVATSSNFYHDEAGNLLGVEGIFRDITERKRSEEALRASEEKFRSIVEASPMGMHFYELHEDGKLTLSGANPSADRLLGVEHATLVGLDIEEAFPGLRGSDIADMYRRVAAGELPAQFFETDYEDGRISGVYAVTVFCIGPNAAATAYLDVTDRRRAEEMMRQSEEKFSLLFKLSPDAISLSEPESGVLVDVNEAFVSLSGFAREELLGRSTLDLGMFVDPEKRALMIERLLSKGHASSIEMECCRKDGMLLLCNISCQFISIGQKRFLLSVVRDMTEFKRMQEMMIQTEKMISVGGIAAGVAHEINNPLAIIVQTAQNMALRVRPDFPRNVEKAGELGVDMQAVWAYLEARGLPGMVRDIQSAAVRAANIIRHMLDFSRRSESRRAPCDMAVVVDKALELAANDYDLKKTFDFRQIRVLRHVPEGLPQVECSEVEIEQVLLNLLRNAAQAMSMADPPTAEPRIDIRLAHAGGEVRVEVEDNGPGVPPEVQRRVFEPFFTTKPPGIGTGLGLSVSYFIVTRGHGGRMWVDSEPGRGAAFGIALPVAGSAEAVPPER